MVSYWWQWSSVNRPSHISMVVSPVAIALPICWRPGHRWCSPVAIAIEQPMNAGLILAILSWLVIGGIMMVGGRGWCLFFCPLGALSGLAHKIGSSVGLYRIDFKAEKCVKCKKCQTNCPVWAIGDDHSIERSLCIGCRECTKSCVGSAYSYKWGREDVREDKTKD